MSKNVLVQPTENEILAGILEESFEEFICYFFLVQNGLKFQCILFLRDIARAVGLIRGVWTFMILRRETV